MTLAELKQRIVVDRLGYTLNDTNMINLVVREINSIIMEDLPARGLRPFILNTDVTTTANVEYVDLPSNFVDIKLVRKLETDGSYKILKPMEWDDMEVTDTGDLYYYKVLPSTDNWRMYFRYIPNDTYTVNIFYGAKETEVSDDADEPLVTKLFGAEIVISGVMYRIADIRKYDDNVLLRWKANYERQIAYLLDTQRRLDGKEYYKDLRYNLYA